MKKSLSTLLALALAIPALANDSGKLEFYALEYIPTLEMDRAHVCDGGIYIAVQVVVKNPTHKMKYVGGAFMPNFKLRTGDITYDVDQGSGLVLNTDDRVYRGVAELPPLFTKKFYVVFTVPIELEESHSAWTLVLPDGDEIPLTRVKHKEQ